MSTAPKIAVTGSTGVLGGYIARDLAAGGVRQRLLARTPAKAPQLPRATVHPFTYSDQDASRRALDGVDTLLMVSTSEGPERLDQHRSFIDAAAAAGVKHLVYTSFAAAAPDAVFTLAREHYVTEEYIKASGMDWTLLRDGFYLDFMEALIGGDGVIRGPAGNGRASFVARTDVARTASTVLMSPTAYARQTYDLTGPEALTLFEVAATISRIRGRAITFHNETVDEAYASRASYGAPPWQVDAWVSTYTVIGSNVMAPISPAIETITGTAPMNLETYLRRNPR